MVDYITEAREGETKIPTAIQTLT